VELARNELITNIIPNANAQRNQSDVDNEDENGSNRQIQDCLLQVYLDCPVSISMTWCWLRCLGFTYDTQKKSFFVDGHERPDIVFCCNEFCTLYLSNLEPRTHRWIQVRKVTVEKWKREKKISEDDFTPWCGRRNGLWCIQRQFECAEAPRCQASHDNWPRRECVQSIFGW
jgi:hypothetical protein